MRTLQVIRPSRTPSRSRLANIMRRILTRIGQLVEVARLDADGLVLRRGRRQVGWLVAAVGAAAFGAVAGSGAVGEVELADGAEQDGFILDPVGDDVDDVAFLLHLAGDADHRRGQHGSAIFLVEALPDDNVGDATLVLEGDEGDVALAGTLTDQDDAREAHLAAVLDPLERRARNGAAAVELGSDEAQGMVAQGEL